MTTPRDTLEPMIDETRKAIYALQQNIEEHVNFFTSNGIDYSSRIAPLASGHWKRYDLMVFQERQLELVQQKLASLLLEETARSLDRLDSSIKTLDSSVGNLSDLTRKLVRSSKLLEYLTTVVVIVTIVAASIGLISVNPLFALLDALLAMVALFVLWIRGMRDLEKM